MHLIWLAGALALAYPLVFVPTAAGVFGRWGAPGLWVAAVVSLAATAFVPPLVWSASVGAECWGRVPAGAAAALATAFWPATLAAVLALASVPHRRAHRRRDTALWRAYATVVPSVCLAPLVGAAAYQLVGRLTG